MIKKYENKKNSSKKQIKFNKLTNVTMKFINHPFQIVESSPWPFTIGMSAFMYMSLNAIFLSYGCQNFYSNSMLKFPYQLSFIILVLSMFMWWYDMIQESVIEGAYTEKVQLNLSIGMFLFIVSEVMFFFGFFWAFFHFSLNPSDAIQGNWPPVSIESIYAYGLPLINTFILLSSGITLTWSHVALLKKNKNESLFGLFLTIFLGLVFTHIQFIEFYLAKFTIADSAYGSVFYMLTGLHGFHVVIGTIFLSIAFIRMILNFFNKSRFSNFELAIWYWHFVDIVWLFVFSFIYCWGNN
jgi:cytochrome c oxidase subunit 3